MLRAINQARIIRVTRACVPFALVVLVVAACANPSDRAAAPPSSIGISVSDVRAAAMKAAIANEDPDPTSVQWVQTTRDAANQLVTPGTNVGTAGSDTVYVIQMVGKFTAQYAHPPNGVFPTGTVVAITVDPVSGIGIGYRLSNTKIDLATLGTVQTIT